MSSSEKCLYYDCRGMDLILDIKVTRTMTVLEILDFICHPNSKANTQKSTYLIQCRTFLPLHLHKSHKSPFACSLSSTAMLMRGDHWNMMCEQTLHSLQTSTDTPCEYHEKSFAMPDDIICPHAHSKGTCNSNMKSIPEKAHGLPEISQTQVAD